MSGAEVRVERMTPDELDDAMRRHPRVYVPMGALEAHGEHLPVGTDGLNAHALCVETARRHGGVVLPVVWQGVGGSHTGYRWTIMMPGDEGIRSNLVASLERLETLGVRMAVIVSGHFAGDQIALIDDVAAEWRARADTKLTVVSTALDRCAESPIPADHAGAFESAVLAALQPELVHLDRLRPFDPADDPDGDRWGEHRHDPRHPLWGVFGPDPRDGVGVEVVPTLIDWLARLGSEHLGEARD